MPITRGPSCEVRWAGFFAATIVSAVSNSPVLGDDESTPDDSAIDISLGTTFVTKYVARGIVFSNNPSVQTWFELQGPLRRSHGETADDEWRWRLGTWHSVQFTNAVGVNRSRTRFQRTFSGWYEADVYAGLVAPLGEHASMTFSYFYYTSPANGFGDIHELEWQLRYDDARWWTGELDGFTLNPAIRVTRELYNADGMERWYFQPSITPSYTFNDPTLPLTVQTPITLGFSPEGWYRDAAGDDLFFGYVQAGLRLSAPIKLFGNDAPPLTLTGGVDALIVNDRSIHGFNKRLDVIGRVGISYSF